MSGREVEASVLTKAALKLKECLSGWDAPGRDEKLDKALKFNQRVWSILQAELSKPDNPLPSNLKTDLLRLSAFVDKRIFEIMAYPAREKLNILIQINENIATGLRTRPGVSAPVENQSMPAVAGM
jgi:flagellar protein FlaF